MTVLEQINTDKKAHVQRMKAQKPLSAIRELAQLAPKPRGFIDALKRKNNDIALIAEVKKASPSKGVIREDFNAVDIARIYESNGAACLSVLTDEPYFQGKDEYLTAVREAVSLPLLRKDFMIDEYQFYEARALGADCVLLIMASLSDLQAREFYDLATSLSLDALFEVHDESELDRALALFPKMVGVNNRNLKTLEVSLDTGLRLAALMPDGILKVGESGLNSFADVHRFKTAGFDAFLIGESLMKQDDIGMATRKILGNC